MQAIQREIPEFLAVGAGEQRRLAFLQQQGKGPTVVWLGSAQSKDVTGCVFELEGGRITLETGWNLGPTVDRGERWKPADVGAAVRQLLGERPAPRPVWGT